MSVVWRDFSTAHPLLLKQQENGVQFEHILTTPLQDTNESLIMCASDLGYVFVYKMLPHLFSVVNGGNSSGAVGYPYEQPHPLKCDDPEVYLANEYLSDAIDARKLPLCSGDVVPWAVLGVRQDNAPALPVLMGLGKITSLRAAEHLSDNGGTNSTKSLVVTTSEGGVFVFTLDVSVDASGLTTEAVDGRISPSMQAIPASPLAPKVFLPWFAAHFEPGLLDASIIPLNKVLASSSALAELSCADTAALCLQLLYTHEVHLWRIDLHPYLQANPPTLPALSLTLPLATQLLIHGYSAPLPLTHLNARSLTAHHATTAQALERVTAVDPGPALALAEAVPLQLTPLAAPVSLPGPATALLDVSTALSHLPTTSTYAQSTHTASRHPLSAHASGTPATSTLATSGSPTTPPPHVLSLITLRTGAAALTLHTCTETSLVVVTAAELDLALAIPRALIHVSRADTLAPRADTQAPRSDTTTAATDSKVARADTSSTPTGTNASHTNTTAGRADMPNTRSDAHALSQQPGYYRSPRVLPLPLSVALGYAPLSPHGMAAIGTTSVRAMPNASAAGACASTDKEEKDAVVAFATVSVRGLTAAHVLRLTTHSVTVSAAHTAIPRTLTVALPLHWASQPATLAPTPAPHLLDAADAHALAQWHTDLSLSLSLSVPHTTPTVTPLLLPYLRPGVTPAPAATTLASLEALLATCADDAFAAVVSPHACVGACTVLDPLPPSSNAPYTPQQALLAVGRADGSVTLLPASSLWRDLTVCGGTCISVQGEDAPQILLRAQLDLPGSGRPMAVVAGYVTLLSAPQTSAQLSCGCPLVCQCGADLAPFAGLSSAARATALRGGLTLCLLAVRPGVVAVHPLPITNTHRRVRARAGWRHDVKRHMDLSSLSHTVTTATSTAAASGTGISASTGTGTGESTGTGTLVSTAVDGACWDYLGLTGFTAGASAFAAAAVVHAALQADSEGAAEDEHLGAMTRTMRELLSSRIDSAEEDPLAWLTAEQRASYNALQPAPLTSARTEAELVDLIELEARYVRRLKALGAVESDPERVNRHVARLLHLKAQSVAAVEKERKRFLETAQLRFIAAEKGKGAVRAEKRLLTPRESRAGTGGDLSLPTANASSDGVMPSGSPDTSTGTNAGTSASAAATGTSATATKTKKDKAEKARTRIDEHVWARPCEISPVARTLRDICLGDTSIESQSTASPDTVAAQAELLCASARDVEYADSAALWTLQAELEAELRALDAALNAERSGSGSVQASSTTTSTTGTGAGSGTTTTTTGTTIDNIPLFYYNTGGVLRE